MGVPSREARLAHARIHCPYWNEGRREEWLASWATLAQGEVRMFDPVGTKEKHGLAHATSEAWDMFNEHLKMNMVVAHVNGDEMAWVIECLFTANGKTLRTHSIETFTWAENGDLTIKTYYDMPESIGADDDPYEHLLGAENVIPN
ncbi:hypothetical protein ABT299_13045 [Spirillospora sp. NPDC000708]